MIPTKLLSPAGSVILSFSAVIPLVQAFTFQPGSYCFCRSLFLGSPPLSFAQDELPRSLQRPVHGSEPSSSEEHGRRQTLGPRSDSLSTGTDSLSLRCKLYP